MFPSPYFAGPFFAPRYFPRLVFEPPDPRHQVPLTLAYRPQLLVSLNAEHELTFDLTRNHTFSITLTSDP